MPIAIITGANSGIGKATAVTFAERGYDVGITWLEAPEDARATLEECRAAGAARAEARWMDLDVPLDDLPAATAPVDELADALGGVDVFVNNAGVAIPKPFLELDLEIWQRVDNIVLTGGFLCAQRAARRMVDAGRGGRIVNVTSVHEHVPLTDNAAYVAAKHGLGGLTKQMAFELARHGITVNAVAPGEIATRATGQEDRDPREIERPAIPVGRPGHAKEIAAAIAWLAEPDARYCTGHSLVVDGGLLLMPAIANQMMQR